MDRDGVIAALNELKEWTQDRIEAVVKAPNAPLEKRLAGVLGLVAFSDLPIAHAVNEMICTLTEPGWDRATMEPTETHMGKLISRLARQSPDEKLPPSSSAMEQIARTLVGIASNKSAVPDEKLDFLLKMLTGRDGMWWIEWIREHRNRG